MIQLASLAGCTLTPLAAGGLACLALAALAPLAGLALLAEIGEATVVHIGRVAFQGRNGRLEFRDIGRRHLVPSCQGSPGSLGDGTVLSHFLPP